MAFRKLKDAPAKSVPEAAARYTSGAHQDKVTAFWPDDFSAQLSVNHEEMEAVVGPCRFGYLPLGPALSPNV